MGFVLESGESSGGNAAGERTVRSQVQPAALRTLRAQPLGQGSGLGPQDPEKACRGAGVCVCVCVRAHVPPGGAGPSWVLTFPSGRGGDSQKRPDLGASGLREPARRSDYRRK